MIHLLDSLERLRKPVHLVVHGKDILTLTAAAVRCGLFDKLNKTVAAVYNSQVFLDQPQVKDLLQINSVGLEKITRETTIISLLKNKDLSKNIHNAIADSKIVKEIVESDKLKSQWNEWVLNPTDSADKGLGKETFDTALNTILYGQNSGKKKKPPLAQRDGNAVYLLLQD